MSASKPTTPHTQVPNLLNDFVIPLLTEAEAKCLLYVVRRTYGFMSGDGQRKEVDRISLSQFESGIKTGEYVLDLGTGLSRPTIIRALSSLEEKELLTIAYTCANCLWDPSENDPVPTPPKPNQAPACPRCRKTLDRQYALAQLTPRKMCVFLQKHDKKGRQWVFDHDVKLFRVIGEDEDEELLANTKMVTEVDIEEIRAQLWPGVENRVGRMIRQRQASMKGKTVKPQQLMNHFYKPALELQETPSMNQALLQKCVENTLDIVLDNKINMQMRLVGTNKRPKWEWFPYAKAVLSSQLANVTEDEGGGTGSERAIALIRDMLAKTADLHENGGEGERDAARRMLQEMLIMVPDVEDLFESQAHADALIRMAFKKGTSDIMGAREALTPYDWYPEWQWPPHLSSS